MNGIVGIPKGIDLNGLQDSGSDKPDPIEIEDPDKYRIRLSDQIEEEPLLLGLKEGERVQRLFTLGNISMIKGKAKSRKSFAATLFIGALLHPKPVYQGLKRSANVKGVLWIDTEQSNYDLHKAMNRIPKMTDQKSFNLYTFALRSADTNERLEQLQKQIERFSEKISFVLVDGFADLIFDINDRRECVEVVTKAMQWSTEYSIHICFILHENKVGTDARGHAGTELTNKSETVFRVSKDKYDPKNCSVVEGEYTRGMGFDPFTFSITDIGTPMILKREVVEANQAKHQSRKSKTVQATSIEDKEHMTRLKGWIKLEKEYTRSEVISMIKNSFGIGKDKAGDFLQWYLKERFFKKTGKDRSPKQRYQFIGNLKEYNDWNYEGL